VADAEATPAVRFPPEVFPWHAATWSSLTADAARLPHALLFAGPAGVGKHDFALRLAAALLCAEPKPENACGRCHSCQLLAAGTHPDLTLVMPEEDRRGIVIDQIRGLGTYLALRPHTAARKVAVLSPADSMNLNAANSLLKILEEPPLGCVLLLVASQPARLPATIRSRCQRVMFPAPEREAALAWLMGREGGEPAAQLLDEAGGAPLRALALAQGDFLVKRETLLSDLERLLAGTEDPVACAQRWKGLGASACIDWLAAFVAGLIRGFAVPGEPAPALLKKTKNVLNLNKLFTYIDVVSSARNGLFTGGLDELLLLEDLLIRWCRLAERSPTIKTGT
jgi:DNA polymerase-3 subunit delta'